MTTRRKVTTGDLSKPALWMELARRGVRVRCKRESRLLSFVGFFWPAFLVSFWTTLGGRTIWAPNGVDTDHLESHEVPIRHELVHIGQFRRWPFVAQLAFALLPFPVLFAWCRWAMERRAYMVQLHAGTFTIDEVVDTLWRNYGWPWPKPWMRRWFAKELSKRV